jgi:hypothetical protein
MSNYAEFWWSWRQPESTERIPMHTCLPRQQFAAQKILQRFLAASGLQVGSIGPILGRFAMQNHYPRIGHATRDQTHGSRKRCRGVGEFWGMSAVDA